MLAHRLIGSSQGKPTVLNPLVLVHADSSILDDSANGFGLSAYGSVSVSTSTKKFGAGSLYFSSGTQGVQLPSSPHLSLDSNFTVDCWVNAASTANMVLLGSNYGGSPSVNNQIQINTQVTTPNTPGLLGIYHPTGGWKTAQGTSVSGTWTHYAVTRSSGTLRFFQNGTLLGSATSSVTYNFSKGAIGALAGYWTGGINGYLDEFRIVVGTAIWTSSFTPPTAPY